MIHSDDQGSSDITNPAKPPDHGLHLRGFILVLVTSREPHGVDHQGYEIDTKVLAHFRRVSLRQPNEMVSAVFIVVDVGLEGVPRKWEFVFAPLQFFAEQYFFAEHSLECCHDPHGKSGLALQHDVENTAVALDGILVDV